MSQPLECFYFQKSSSEIAVFVTHLGEVCRGYREGLGTLGKRKHEKKRLGGKDEKERSG